MNPIGEAKLLPDGTIELSMWRPHALIRYPKDDPRYAEILAHVGPLEPGKPRPVAPWPDDIDDARVRTVVDEYVETKKKWDAAEWTYMIAGTDKDRNIAVTVTHKKDLVAPRPAGKLSFKLLIHPETYAVVSEIDLQAR